MKPMWKRMICYVLLISFLTGRGQYTPDVIKADTDDIFLTSLKIANADSTRYLKVGKTADLKTESEPSNATKMELIWKLKVSY